MMKLHSNDIVIVDTSAIITKRGGGRVIDKLLKSCVKMAISDSLLEEYLDKCRILGYSPANFWNLWATTKAKVVVTQNISDAEVLKQKCGMPYSSLKSFLDDY